MMYYYIMKPVVHSVHVLSALHNYLYYLYIVLHTKQQNLDSFYIQSWLNIALHCNLELRHIWNLIPIELHSFKWDFLVFKSNNHMRFNPSWNWTAVYICPSLSAGEHGIFILWHIWSVTDNKLHAFYLRRAYLGESFSFCNCIYISMVCFICEFHTGWLKITPHRKHIDKFVGVKNFWQVNVIALFCIFTLRLYIAISTCFPHIGTVMLKALWPAKPRRKTLPTFRTMTTIYDLERERKQNISNTLKWNSTRFVKHDFLGLNPRWISRSKNYPRPIPRISRQGQCLQGQGKENYP